jgi:catechol 2,3-dioxygenase
MSMTAVEQHSLYDGAENDEVLCPTLHHVGIFTTRFDEMLEYYATVVGMRTNLAAEAPLGNGNETRMRMAFLSNDAADHRITLCSYEGLKDVGRNGYARSGQHVAFEYASIDELFRTYKRLHRLGVEIGVCEAHGLSTNMYLKDPDGNIVELRVNNFATWEESTAYLRSVADNPGARVRGAGSVDFDKMIVAREAGATPLELYERALKGEFEPTSLPDLTFKL